MTGQYSTEKYARKLCNAVEAYNGSDGYPKVTYNFRDDDEAYISVRSVSPDKLRNIESKSQLKRLIDGNTIYEFEDDRICHHTSMDEVETLIRNQLRNPEPTQVKNGLSNVLFWGWARSSYRQKNRVAIFRRDVTSDHLERFMGVAGGLTGPGLSAIRGRVNNKQDNLPQLTGMSFVSKVRMFLDPLNYPVLDEKLAEEFSQSAYFPPLKDLTFRKKKDSTENNGHDTQIRITKDNEEVYEKWGLWCSGIAHLVNCKSPSALRAVDVERAIYHLEDEGRISEAWRLLKCPYGYTHDQVMALGRQTND